MEKFNQKEGKPFNGLMESIKRYFNTLFRDEKSESEKRIQLYNNRAWRKRDFLFENKELYL